MSTAADDSVIILARHPDGKIDEGTVAGIDEIDRLIAQPGTLVWVCVTDPSDELISELQKEFGLHALAVEDLRKRNQRPKLDTLRGPACPRRLRSRARGQPAPLGAAPLLLRARGCSASSSDRCRWSTRHCADLPTAGKGLADSVDALVYLVLDAAVDSYFPELDRLSDRIDAPRGPSPLRRRRSPRARRAARAEAPSARAAARAGADARPGQRAPAPRRRHRQRQVASRTSRISTTT